MAAPDEHDYMNPGAGDVAGGADDVDVAGGADNVAGAGEAPNGADRMSTGGACTSSVDNPATASTTALRPSPIVTAQRWSTTLWAFHTETALSTNWIGIEPKMPSRSSCTQPDAATAIRAFPST
ncbi:uncharacterized protein LOC144111257 isoform X1 [Amblyomma americanum]